MGPQLEQVDCIYVRHGGRRLLYFAGCDYHRLASHPTVLAAARNALSRLGLNVAASRATTGNHPLYAKLEAALARFFQADQAVLLPGGYAANTVVAQALAGHIDRVFVDAAAHASLLDAARHLACPVSPFRHADPADLRARMRRLGPRTRPLILTDGLFARTGTIAPLASLLDTLPPQGWLVLDDAHGVGVLGATGRGTPEYCGVRSGRLIQTCTLSKAFGAYGGVILAPRSIAKRVVTASRQFAASTPLPLPLAAAALAALRLIGTRPSLRQRLAENVRSVKIPLQTAGFDLPNTPAPIVSVLAARPPDSARLTTALLRRGIYPSFIRYPGGPDHGYFRFTLSSQHQPPHIEALVSALLSVPGLASVAE